MELFSGEKLCEDFKQKSQPNTLEFTPKVIDQQIPFALLPILRPTRFLSKSTIHGISASVTLKLTKRLSLLNLYHCYNYFC